ncbi:proline-rich protein 14 isoform X2 [Rhinatrema bivittatum]|uniref:proline-rich protein 14 isoform X2 n=1 Tax=Rhinatrema bivittatum TaxID=194408 RepID=UPI00112B43B5|nr:proline-rich protein 14 isoform X2 [Rhinatrema bivittatum]
MDCTSVELESEKGLHLSPIPTLTRTHRRKRLIIYRPSTEDQEGPVLGPQAPQKQDEPPSIPQCAVGERKALQVIPLKCPREELEEGDMKRGVEGRKRRKLTKSNCLASGDSVRNWQQKHRRWRKDLTAQASPIERSKRRVLAVVLQDLASQESEEEKVEDSTYLKAAEKSSSGNQLTPRSQSEGTEYWSPVVKVPRRELSGEGSRETPSNNERAAAELRLLASPVGDSLPGESESQCYKGWRIGPLFHSMRCKLETFAEILLTPVKNKWAVPEPANDPTHSDSPPSSASEATSLPPREAKSCSEGEGVAASQQKEMSIQSSLPGVRVNPAQPGMKIEVKIAISEPQASSSSSSPPCSIQDFPLPPHCRRRWRECGEVSCRPPIRQWRSQSSCEEWSSTDEQEPPGDLRPLLFEPRLSRSYSCPNFPSGVSSPSSLLLAGSLQAPQLSRQRRHTVCSVEVSRELRQKTFTLPCLKKEVFPFPIGGSSRLQHSFLSPVMCLPRCDPSPMESSSGPVLSRHRVSSPHQITPHRGARSRGALDHNRPGPPEAESLSKKEQLGLRILEETSLSDSEIKNMDNSQHGSTGKVSRFRIRKRPAKQQSNLTPMGLPKPVRLNKTEFSLEEIYTNKNYRTPTEKRSFETIFEEPLERNGDLIFTSQRKVKRLVEFHDASIPRKRKTRLRTRLAAGVGGGRAQRRRRQQAEAGRPDVETLLRHRLDELDALFADEEQ